MIHLRRAKGVRKVQEHSFQIETPLRIYVIVAGSGAEADAWMEAVSHQIKAVTREDGSKVVKQGTLTKQGGGFKSWKKRWFVLTKDNLLTYYEHQGVSPRSSFYLNSDYEFIFSFPMVHVSLPPTPPRYPHVDRMLFPWERLTSSSVRMFGLLPMYELVF